ncbi:MAG: hypothetical protein ABSA57_16085, partial [Candidatus Acidiferrales bacterium]
AGYIVDYTQDVEVRNSYFHGWSHAGGAADNFFAFSATTCCTPPYSVVGSMFHDNVVDGSDTSKDMMNGVFLGADQVYNNYFQYVVSALLGSFNSIHDNLVQYPVISFAGDHANGIFNFGPQSGNHILMYNNVVRHTTACSGCVNFWLDGNNGPNPSTVAYMFGNVLYDLNPSNVINIPAHTASNYGTFYVFNNTVQGGNDSDYGAPVGQNSEGQTYTVYDYNNHWLTTISSPSAFPFCNSGGTCNGGTQPPDLFQNLSAANGQGYSEAEVAVFSPASGCTSSTCATVGSGVNLQSYCSAISGINAAAGTACQNSATDGVGYNTTTHTVIYPGLATVARPTSAAWDRGAYQYSGAQAAQTPQAPTSLQATVQ